MSRRRLRPFALALSLLTAGAACAPGPAAGGPPAAAGAAGLRPAEARAVVTSVAGLIEAHYVREAKARAIAAGLRDAAGRGAFDRDANPLDLATSLSERLRREDGHFQVVFTPKTPGAERAPAALTPMSDAALARRFNHWFRRVEVLPGNVGYIHLSEFADLEPDAAPAPTARQASGAAPAPTARQTADAALAFVANADAMIFDLRDNGGGGDMATYVLSHYLPPGLLLGTMRGRTKSTEARTLSQVGGARRLDVPLYVLISGRTASAAEFFAYSLKTLGRATVVGETSAGAANPYEEFDAGRGFCVAIPVDEPVDARSGKSWEGVGVAPDVPVASADALARAQALALAGLLRRPADAASARDTRWALDALRPLAPPPAPAALAAYAGSYGTLRVRADAGALFLERATWPPRTLRPVGDDAFRVEGEPWVRVMFERDARGRVVAMSQLDSSGGVRRFSRAAPAGAVTN